MAGSAEPEPRQSSPEAAANLWQCLTFSWLGRVIQEGYRREVQRAQRANSDVPASGGEEGVACPAALTEDDLYKLRPDDMPRLLHDFAELAWNEELGREASARSYQRALRRAFGATFFVAGVFKFVYDTLQMGGPYILKEFLAYLGRCNSGAQSPPGQGGGDCSFSSGLVYVVAMCVVAVIQTAVLHQYFHRTYRTGMRLNAASITLIYSKALRTPGPGKGGDHQAPSAAGAASSNGASNGQRSSGAGGAPRQAQRSTGEVVNLMSVDSQRLQDLMPYLHTLWSGPYQIVISVIFLAFVVGWATVAGIAVILLQIPVVTLISGKIKKAQRALMKIKDQRIKVTNELFESVRLVKLYGWEESFQARVDSIREAELRQLKTYQMMQIISQAVWSTAPIITGVATFGVYTLLHGALAPSTAFTALALFNVLRFPMAMFPNMVTSSVEATVALKRVQDFLESREVEGRTTPSTMSFQVMDNMSRPAAISMTGASLAWPDGTPLIENMQMLVPAPDPAGGAERKAHLTVVLGTVGVGKSGLLQAIVGDLTPFAGSLLTSGTMAYTSQVAWIRNATVKDNILFNHPYDEARYQQVLEACCLLPDMQELPNGEATEIGEKGVNLSGGQKQRVALARAVYAAADILLLDDPLSAVDAEVGKKLLSMLRGPLVRGSSIVLCTHQLNAVQQADQVILLERERSPTSPSTAPSSSPPSPSSPPSGAATAFSPARVAFCGEPKEFNRRYPEYVTRTASKEVAVAESADGDGQKKTEKEGAPNKEKAGKLVEKEAESVGSVSIEVYKTYIQAAGGMGVAGLVLLGVVAGMALQTGADSWVSFWSDHSACKPGQICVSNAGGLLGYTAFSILAFVGIFSTQGLFRVTALNAARFFHRQLLLHLLKLPMRFFDTTPLGRILNRFSKDVYTIDEQLTSILSMYMQTLSRVVATIVVIAIATPWFLLVVMPILYVYRWVQNYYIPASRQIKRIESNLRSPIFSHFSETLDGVESVRAYGQQKEFSADMLSRLERNMKAYYLNVSSNRWLAVRLESLGTVIVSCAGLLAVFARDTLTAGMAGLSISYALSVTQSLNWVVRMTSDRETNIVSVERVGEYLSQAPEPPRLCPERDPAPSVWPSRGAIEFSGVTARYRPDLPIVLDSFTLSVQPGEKLGICGRTGAGKSSVLNVLLRIVEPEAGRITIDSVDIGRIGLHRLRQSIAIIPQDPVMFSGELRFNLDPLGGCTDEQCWQALRRAHLVSDPNATPLSPSTPEGSERRRAAATLDVNDLSYAVSERGQKFSLGQRQQLCLARALLRSNRILLLDEATSAVDVDTDAVIQEAIRTEFAQHTVLCIAHRIATIMESDRVCVLEGGQIAELGKPKALLQGSSRFAQLAHLDGLGDSVGTKPRSGSFEEWSKEY